MTARQLAAWCLWCCQTTASAAVGVGALALATMALDLVAR